MDPTLKVTKELIREEFSSDPVFLANMVKSKDKLFPSFLETLYVNVQYSAKEAGEFIGSLVEKGSESHIRYYMRPSNLETYIEPLQKGRSIRLLYKSIYRLYLISLYLSADEKRNLLDVKDLLPEYNVQPLVKGRKSSSFNEVGTEGQRKIDKSYEAAMMSLVMAEQNKEGMYHVMEFVVSLWNDFVTTKQLNKQLNDNIDEIIKLEKRLSEEEKELTNLQIELANVKNKLRNDAQFNNMHKVYKEFRAYKKENSSLLGRLFPKKQQEDTDSDFSKVTGDEPQIIALNEKIKGQEDIVLKTLEELNELEAKRETLSSQEINIDQDRVNKMLKLMENYRLEDVNTVQEECDKDNPEELEVHEGTVKLPINDGSTVINRREKDESLIVDADIVES